MLRKPVAANPPPESRYEVLALFTASMIGSSIFLMANGTLVPFFERAYHLRQEEVGFVLSAQLIGSMFTTGISGMLTDRFGDKAVVLWSGWVMGIALLVASLVPNFHWMLAWLLIYGIGYAAVTPAGSHAIVYFFKQEDRGFAMGLRQCGVPIAGVAGSILLPAVALHFDYQWAIASAGIATIVACTAASLLYREPAELAGEPISVRAMLVEMVVIARDVRLILLTLTSMLLMCAQVGVMAFLPVTIVHEAGYQIAQACTIFTISQVAAIAGRLGWGWASDNIFKGSRAEPLALNCALTALAALSVASISHSTPYALMAAIAVFIGLTAEGWLGLSVIAFAEIGGAEHSGSALGAALTWVMVAGFASPTFFGAVAQARGDAFAWQMLAGIVAAGIFPAMLASYAIRRLAKLGV